MIPKISSMSEYQKAWQSSITDPEKFWQNIAKHFQWHKTWSRVVGEQNFEQAHFSWFDGAELNITENALDRHLLTRGDKIAFIWEPNNPSEQARKLTYRELHSEVCRFANVLKNHKISKGDRVCLYMPMTPEAVIAMLACARIGAVHSVVFGGFSASSLADRINDASAKMVITADGSLRGSKEIPLKPAIDEAIKNCPSIETILVLKRSDSQIDMVSGRDFWWHDEIKKANPDCPAVSVDAEDPLFILYTSGSTGKPKGVVHSSAGYMVYVGYSFAQVFQANENDIYWCTADIGWITGHSYLVYGPLLNGVTSVIFEGIPTWPDAGRFWQTIDKHQVSIFYTAPTAIRSLMAQGLDFVTPHQLDSLRVLGSVGEPINEEAWQWYFDHIGKKRCPIVDTWWQTETGGILISPLAGITPPKPSFATLPLPGIEPVLLDSSGKELAGNDVEGNLCFKKSWPSIIRTTYGDHERFQKTYFSDFSGYYQSGDIAHRDADGYYRINGRSDDVLKVSGHRIGTAEVENAINMHSSVVESAVVGYPHDIKGQAIYAFVIATNPSDQEQLKKEITENVVKEIGPLAKPDKIQFVRELPKTRSGKIMRRILRKIASGETENIGDTTTLLDPSVVNEIQKGLL